MKTNDLRAYLTAKPGEEFPYGLVILEGEQKFCDGIMLDGFETMIDAWTFAVCNGLPDPTQGLGDSNRKWTKEAWREVTIEYGDDRPRAPRKKRRGKQLKLGI